MQAIQPGMPATVGGPSNWLNSRKAYNTRDASNSRGPSNWLNSRKLTAPGMPATAGIQATG
jgi:hypothetical protein